MIAPKVQCTYRLVGLRFWCYGNNQQGIYMMLSDNRCSDDPQIRL